LRPIVFNKAGNITLVKYNANGTLSLTDASKYIAANGVIESIKPDIETTSTELPDGNSDWPMGDYDSGKKGNIDVSLSSFQPNLYAALMGVSKVAETTENMWVSNEPGTIPESSAFVVSLENAVAAGGVIVVADNTGSPFVSAASGPTAGQYTVSGADLTFNSADASKQVFATYQYASATSESVSLPDFSTRPKLYAIISGKAITEDEAATIPFNVIVDACKLAGKLTPPSQERAAKPWNFSLKVMKPRSGYKAVDFRYQLS